MTKKRTYGLVVLVTLAYYVRSQCPPTTVTTTITGLYTVTINPPPSSTIYIAPTATVTGDINLVNSSLYNCGYILSKKITMRQSVSNTQYILENNNIINSDTICLDSLGHLHNNDTLLTKQLWLQFNSEIDNNYYLFANNLKAESGSVINSQSKIQTDYFELKDNNTQFYDLYGTTAVKKLFRVSANTIVYGSLLICVDSCMINAGLINSIAPTSWTSTIKVSGISTNSGTIQTVDFCDLSSVNGGMPDNNSGALVGMTYCLSQLNYCDYIFSGLNEENPVGQLIHLYPNPVSNTLFISSEINEFENSELEISNCLGQTVLKLPFKNEISVSDLSSGSYFLKIITLDRRQFYSKFIKQ